MPKIQKKEIERTLLPHEIRLENGDIRPMTEAEIIQSQIKANTGQTLESTRRMLTLCEEAKESGLQTLVMLDDQGEQLDRINEGLDKINEDMKDAEKNLDDLNKCCGLCILPWAKVANFQKSDYEKTWAGNDDGKDSGASPRIVVDQNGSGPAGGYITRITNDEFENEIDQNLQEVTGMIGNLRNMAIDMGSEITQQNKQIAIIVSKAQLNEERIKKANDQATKLLK